MSSSTLLPVSAGGIRSSRSSASMRSSSAVGFEMGTSDLHAQCKKRRLSSNNELPCEILTKFGAFLPILTGEDYYMEPCVMDLVARELVDPGYCGRVPDFSVGRFGYGSIRFFGKTDVRWLDLDKIVKFRRHEVFVYEDESPKPPVGQGLNKPAEVTLVLQISSNVRTDWVNDVAKKLRVSMERQGAEFISFNPTSSNWKFSVSHFSRFGLTDDDEEDITMDDLPTVQDPVQLNDDDEVLGVDQETDQVELEPAGPMLYHSLPAHLGLDPVRMKEMRMLMFPVEEEDELEDISDIANQKSSYRKESMKSPSQNYNQKMIPRSSPPLVRKTPLPLLEYNPGSLHSSSSRNILMAQQNKGLPSKMIKAEGFKLDLKHQTPVTRNHSRNIVDAGLFMGRSFRVGWGPNGVLVHTGSPVGSNKSLLTSVINVENVAIDKVARDENNKSRKELIEFGFDSPLKLFKEISHEIKEIEVGSFRLKLQKAVCNRLMLSDICRSYIDIIERQLEVPGLSSSSRLVLMHQVMIWELIKVLFSERENTGQLKSIAADNEEEMMQDMKESSPGVDEEALPLIRRAEFSCWLQESVCHRVQEEVSSLNESSYLEHTFSLLTGRQLDAATELAASKGDVRLACLLSQAGGSVVNRADVSQQLDRWRINGLDFNFIEKERIRLYELLGGNIHDSLDGGEIDWKRFLGLLMWYQLAPNTPLPIIFRTYQHLLDECKAPIPKPIYIDEGLLEETVNFGEKHFDLSYYLMLLHANGSNDFGFTKTMFSAFSSTNDPLDYHMIWHQRAVLEAVGIFSSNDLQVLDMGLVSQLLSVGQCHWAIYVVLHMPYCDNYPHLHATLIREILFQYCETWNTDQSQRDFINELGVPSAWLHEALAIYFSYHGDFTRALEHFLGCENWQKAHSIFMISIAPVLFLSANHSEIWRLATSMEGHKSEIENWELGAAMYISFYLIRSSFLEEDNAMSELESLESKESPCRDFLGHLNESLAVLGNQLPTDARVAYSMMAEEICELLLSNISEGSSRDGQLSCFDTVFIAPVPEDRHSNHLQDAVSLFTCYLSEMAASS
ncbi:hypothetical protein K2173_019216 [Erythroxylum novogranatense]|uniref:Peptidase S59 domain-containing protein n=1 Tax=Erythroxylum novogranatense TaxID=1862640 RepID=A0AAV8STZ9_9ROSI|nr:hypothetical protein K2173_019216 [Erythroxylum novogranatense]